jgi:hypothetical protein
MCSFLRPNTVGLSFKTTRSISQKRLSPPLQRASSHLRSDYNNTGGNAFGYTPTIVDFHLFSRIKGALGGKGLRDDDENLFVQQWLDEQQQLFFERGIVKVPER